MQLAVVIPWFKLTRIVGHTHRFLPDGIDFAVGLVTSAIKNHAGISDRESQYFDPVMGFGLTELDHPMLIERIH
jgi:hypothetical protein